MGKRLLFKHSSFFPSSLQGLNDIITAQDFNELPPSDILNAGDMQVSSSQCDGGATSNFLPAMQYDTVVDGFIPENPEDAYKLNVMKNTRIDAVLQVNSMLDTVDEIAKQVGMKCIGCPLLLFHCVRFGF